MRAGSSHEIIDVLPENQSLASRMAAIAERYEMICNTGVTLTHDEESRLRAVLVRAGAGKKVILTLGQLLSHDDSGASAEVRLQFADRVALIELLGF